MQLIITIFPTITQFAVHSHRAHSILSVQPYLPSAPDRYTPKAKHPCHSFIMGDFNVD